MKSTEERYAAEREYFDNVASHARVSKMPEAVIERYKDPRHPSLFPLEKMFSLIKGKRGLRIFQIGSGEGITAVELAHCGHHVTGVDISPKAVQVAKKRAEIEEVDARFIVGNVVTDDIWETSSYDVVWCEAILHHLVGDLDVVIAGARRALRPGGLLLICEPLALPPGLQFVRDRLPIKKNGTEAEQPLRETELQILRHHFPDISQRQYRIFSRIDRLTKNVTIIGTIAAIDNILLSAIPPTKALSSVAVMWARKP